MPISDTNGLTVLSINNLSNDFFGPVSLNVAAGECIAIRGASGAGKSVLLRAIADLDPSDGDIRWHNRRRESTPPPDWRCIVGYVPADTGWWADIVAAHFDDVDELAGQLASVGLPAQAIEWEIARLSTGERHRLGLLRTFLRSPPVLLLDEPTASLDAEATEQIEALMRACLRNGTAIVLVTHDPTQAERLATRSFEMTAGTLTPTDAVATT